MEKYLDPNETVDVRVKDLIDRMTIEEKFREIGMYTARSLTENNCFSLKRADDFFQGIGIGAIEIPGLNPAENIACVNALQKYLIEKTRLGIPTLIISECLHGFVSSGSTMFPQSIALGSSWDKELIKDIAIAIAKEGYSCGSRQALSPNLDLAREPRWGRFEESYSEDPYLCGELGLAYIKGLQGEKSGILEEDKLVATVKHFAAHGSPESGVNLSPVQVGERQLRELYLPPFKKAFIEGGALSAMPAYSEMDGIPCTTSKFLLQKILREEWGFCGYVFSDYGAIRMLFEFQKVAETSGQAGQMALEAGIDLEAPSIFCFGKELLFRVRDGKTDIKMIDQAVARVLRVKFICGLFERPYIDKTKSLHTVHCKKHQELALKAAQESIILLKNNNCLLPLSKKIGSIAIIGPNANVVQLGDYSIKKDSDVTLLQGVKNRVSKETTVYYAKGCELYGSITTGFQEAVEIAKKAEVAIIAVGTSSNIYSGVGWGTNTNEKVTCGEGYDWTDLKLPGMQEQLVKEVAETGIPTIVVLINGRPLTFDYISESIPAIIEAWYPGEEGGNAMSDVIFGNVNPSGKLTVSFPKVFGQSPIFYNHKPSARGYYHKPGSTEHPGRDYVFNDTNPLYDFGFGLSYTEFKYFDLTVSHKVIDADDHIDVSLIVQNIGDKDGKEVVQLYLNDVYSRTTTPVKALKGFKKIFLKAGEMQRIIFTLTGAEMSLYDENMQEIIEPGLFEVMVGNLKAEFHVRA